MSALDELQRSLSRAVDAGAAADPSRAQHATAHHSRARSPRGLARLRPRRGWHVFLAIFLAGGITTGALAATGQLPILRARTADLDPNPRQYGGVREGNAKLLSLRVTDPDGGPPWALRTFTTNRDAACVQVGQVYKGAFGEAERDRAGRLVFRRRQAEQGAAGVMCSGVARNGLPVLRGTRSLLRRGTPKAGFDPKYGSCSTVSGACKITSAAIVRFGMLGPAARSATFVDADGKRSEPQALAARDGGAYLFVQPTDPAPYAAYDAVMLKVNERIRAKSKGVSTREQFRIGDRVMREMKPEIDRALARLKMRGDGVDATFVDGTTLRVAGKGRRGGRLPGVAPTKSDLPASVQSKLAITQKPGPKGSIVVSFRSPVALQRFDRHYIATLIGPIGPKCGRESRRNRYVTTTSFKLGAPVRITLKPYQYDGARQPWCKRPHVLNVTLVTGSSLDGGKLVGAASVTPH